MSHANALQRLGAGLCLSLAWGITGAAVPNLINPAQSAPSPGKPAINPSQSSSASEQIAQAFGDSFYLYPGFLPDPAMGSGVSLGGDEIFSICGMGGTIALDLPSHTLTVERDFDYLHIYFGEVFGASDASEDLVLVMHDRQTGDVLCLDDTDGSFLPEFEGYLTEGVYDIYVGDFDLSEGSSYNIYLSEYAPSGSTAVGNPQAPTAAAEALWDSFYLYPGFLPDPAIGSGVSLGVEEAALVCDIGGTIALAQPSHTLTAEDDFNNLHIYFGEVFGPSEASEDLVLVMYDRQTGDFFCADDSNDSLLPEFTGYLAAGTYDIYVGDFDPSEGSSYNIYLSEF